MSTNLGTTQNVRGRPPIDIDLSLVASLLPDNNYSVRQVARVLGVAHSTLQYHVTNSARIEYLRSYYRRKTKGKSLRPPTRIHRFHRRLVRMVLVNTLLQNGTSIAHIAKQIGVKATSLYACFDHSVADVWRSAQGIGKAFCAQPQGKERVCRKCSATKPLRAFYFKRAQGTYRHDCIECCRAQAVIVWRERGRPSRALRGRCYNYKRVTKLTECYPYLLSANSDGADILTRINKLVPRNIPEVVRADVCQALALAVLSGEIEIENLAAHIKRLAKEQYEFLPSRYGVSLDAPIADGHTYRLIDTISTDDYNNAFGVRNFYGDALSDCDETEDLAERLRDAWDANRLKTPQRRVYSRFSASHEDDNRHAVAAAQGTGHAGMHVKVRRWRHIPPSRKGIEAKLDELAYSKEDYLDQRIAEELGISESLTKSQ